MLHLTVQELLDLRGQRILQLADRDGDGAPDEGTVTAAIVSAELEAREILLTRFRPEELPSTPETTPANLKDAIADLVPYHLLKGTGAQISEATLRQYELAKSRLRTMAQGGLSVGTLPGSPASDVSRPTVRAVGTRPAADRISLESLKEW